MELMRRLAAIRSEVAAYEHGRSQICRFHAADRGHSHAHVHVIPTNLKVIEKDAINLLGDQNISMDARGRYIYEMVGLDGFELFSQAAREVPRHFVRSRLQYQLQQNHDSVIPLSAAAGIHYRAIEQTKSLLSSQDRHRCITSVALISSTQVAHGIVEEMGGFGWQFKAIRKFSNRVNLLVADANKIQLADQWYRVYTSTISQGKSHYETELVVLLNDVGRFATGWSGCIPWLSLDVRHLTEAEAADAIIAAISIAGEFPGRSANSIPTD